jgi:hypothetical protein
MPTFEIEAGGDVHEVYYVEANDEGEAHEKFDRGDLPTPAVSEVEGSFLRTIREVK